MKEKIVAKIRHLIGKEVREVLKEDLEKMGNISKRMDDVPIAICWYCHQGIKGGIGRIQYMGKSFHPEVCFDEYCRVIDRPDQNYKLRKGRKVREYFQ